MLMTGTSFVYHRLIISSMRLVADSIMYVSLHVCSRISIDIMSMFAMLYMKIWLSYSLFGED